MAEMAFGVNFSPASITKVHVDLEVHDGVRYVSLNDHYRYVLTNKTLAQSQQGLRRHTASSEMFDGEVTVHTSRSNVTETVEVYVLGNDHITVGDNIDLLIDAFSQRTFNIRRTLGTDVQVWTCYPAEYAIDQSHVNIHNTRAVVTISVPRMPKVYREVLD